MHIMITGGAGFIGKRLTRLWLEAGASVTVLDWLASDWDLPEPDKALIRLRGDIRDAEALKAAFSANPEIVYHLAAIHHIPTCESQRSLTLSVNVVGTELLLEQAALAGTAALILASSGAVYRPVEEMLTESSPLEAIDNYALSKMANERQLHYWQQRTGARAAIARIFNTIGHDDPNGHLIPDILSQLTATDYSGVIRLGNLTPRRDYIHADDTAGALWAIGRDIAKVEGCRAINICTGTETAVADLVRMLADVCGRSVRIEVDPARVRKVDRSSQVGSLELLRGLTGFQPRHDLRASLEAIARRRFGKPGVPPVRVH